MSEGGDYRDAQPPDVGAILEALRAEVRARRLAQAHAEPSEAERELRRALDEIELHRVISAHWPLLGRTLPQRAIALVNKLVRRYLRWYINPIVEQQNAYNDAVARTLRLLAAAYVELGEQVANHQPPQNREPGTENREPGAKTSSRRSLAENDEPQALDHGQAQTAHYAELMALVRARAAAERDARLPDLALRAMEPQLRLREQVSAHWPLPGKTISQRGVALVNKLVRRYLRWYINPIVEQQNAANAALTLALLRLIALDAERRAEVAARRARR
jgi:hypothetical protein